MTKSAAEIIANVRTLDRDSQEVLLEKWKDLLSLHNDSIARFDKRGSIDAARRLRAMLPLYNEVIGEMTNMLNE